MKKLFVIVALLATPAMAQQPNEYHLTVTPSELDVISDGLQTVPFGKAFPLINKLRDQIVAQQPKPPVPPVAPSAPVEAPKPDEAPK